MFKMFVVQLVLGIVRLIKLTSYWTGGERKVTILSPHVLSVYSKVNELFFKFSCYYLM